MVLRQAPWFGTTKSASPCDSATCSRRTHQFSFSISRMSSDVHQDSVHRAPNGKVQGCMTTRTWPRNLQEYASTLTRRQIPPSVKLDNATLVEPNGQPTDIIPSDTGSENLPWGSGVVKKVAWELFTREQYHKRRS